MSPFTTKRELFFFLLHPSLWFRPALEEDELSVDPFATFKIWYLAAQRKMNSEFPNAMCLSTISPDGYPEGRIVLLKEWSEEGFVFYTNYQSQKGKALEACPRASLTFYWGNLQRQVRIQGTVSEVSSTEADDYFHTRPRRSQIGAWASAQSSVLQSRSELNDKMQEFENRFASNEIIPRPDYWGGYRLTPRVFEFWQLRLNRLHDRIEYRKDEQRSWEKRRLSP